MIEPPASLAALEEYAEASSGRLVYLALEMLGVHDPGAGEAGLHVGIAYSLAGLLRAMPFHARAGRQFIPADIAARNGLSEQDYRALRSTPALRSATAELAAAASRHLGLARAHRAKIPRSALPALLPAVVAQRSLLRLKRAAVRPVRPGPGGPGPSAELATCGRGTASTGTESFLPALEIREAAVGHCLDAFLEILGAAQPVLFDELALGRGFDGVAEPAAHRLARRHDGERRRLRDL